MTPHSRCNDIQTAIASEQALSDEQRRHVDRCQHCRSVQEQVLVLRALVEETLQPMVPDGFADRVISGLDGNEWAIPTIERGSDPRWMDVVSRSRWIQALLLGLGIALGIGHVARFFVGLFIVTMAVAG